VIFEIKRLQRRLINKRTCIKKRPSFRLDMKNWRKETGTEKITEKIKQFSYKINEIL